MEQAQKPRRTQAERTRSSREKIIRSATETFAQKGFRGAKMADIARAADLTEPGLLHHFPSKTHLLMEVLKERDRVDSERIRATQQKNGNHFLDAQIELVEHNQTVPGLVQLFSLMVAESISPDHPAHGFFVERYQRERGQCVRFLEQAQQAGEIRADISAEALGVLLFALMDGLQVQWLLEPEKIDMGGLFRLMMGLFKVNEGR